MTCPCLESCPPGIKKAKSRVHARLLRLYLECYALVPAPLTTPGLLPCGEQSARRDRWRAPQRQTDTAPHRSSSSRPSALAAVDASSPAAVSTRAEAARGRAN